MHLRTSICPRCSVPVPVDDDSRLRVHDVPTDLEPGSPALAFAVRRCPGSRLPVATISRDLLAPSALSVSEARRMVHRLLVAADRADLVDTAELLVSEIATNALEGTSTPVELCCTVHDLGVRIEISVGVPVLPPQRGPDATGVGGRGVALLGRLAGEWGVTRYADGGRTIWFTLPTQPAPTRDAAGA